MWQGLNYLFEIQIGHLDTYPDFPPMKYALLLRNRLGVLYRQ